MAQTSKRALVSQRAYARQRGVSCTAVQEAIKAGRISTVNGKIDPKRADREWERNTDPSKPRNDITGDPKHRRPPGSPPVPMDLDRHDRSDRTGHRKTSEPSSYSEARADRELWEAQLAKLRLDRQLGLLVLASEVKQAAVACAQRTRDELVALPERVAPILAATDDPDEIRKILDDEIERICQELSGADAERS